MDTSLIHVGLLPENTREVLVYLGNDRMPADFDQLAYSEAILRGWAQAAGIPLPFHVTKHDSALAVDGGVQVEFTPIESLDDLKAQVGKATDSGRLVFVRVGDDDNPITQETYQEAMAYLSEISYDRLFVCGHVFRFVCSTNDK